MLRSTLASRGRLPAFLVGVTVVLLGVLAGPASVRAQQGGMITGTIRDVASRSPIAGAQVYLVGTNLGTVALDNGRYVIQNVPPGTYQVRLERIGYAAMTRQATVTSGASVQLDFELESEALGLDEIFVTGTAGAARRRELGNSLSQVNTAVVAEPVVNVDQLLQARATGLTITETGAQAGAASMIRLRGNVSMSQSNQPLIYVDGVRIRGDPYQRNIPPESAYQSRGPNTVLSPMADIDPTTIERVEVIKGAAATTLYGTEAGAGVIQIFTKQGSVGRTRWTLQANGGMTDILPFNFVTPDVLIPTGVGNAMMKTPRMRMDPFLRKGYQQSYSLSAQGQTGGFRYYLSGSYADNQFSMPLDNEEKYHVKGNFGFTPLPSLDVSITTDYNKSTVQNTPCGNNSSGICLNAYRAEQNYVGGYEEELIEATLDYPLFSYIDHLIAGTTFTYSPGRFSSKLTFGYDRAFIEHTNYRPFGYIAFPPGSRGNFRFLNQTLTADYSGHYQIAVSDDLNSTVSWGAQAVEKSESGAKAYSEGFAGPGLPTVTSGAVKMADEMLIRVMTAGFFGQVMVGFKDRYFLTGGVRMDGNSAFGKDLGLEMYPKISGTWVVSDEPFWGEGMGQLKLRAAYGQAGRAPGAFDAVRTWNPTSLGNIPGFLPQNLGNSSLGPERTAGMEAGFDLSLFGDRFTAEYTYYKQSTTDALFAVRAAPSLGGWDSQLENVGSLTNAGNELTLRAGLVETDDWGASVGLGIATNHSEITSLGGAPQFQLGDNTWVIEGQPAPVVRGDCVTNADELAAPIIEKECIFGPNSPTTILTPSVELRFPYGIRLSGRGEYMGGFYMSDGPSANAVGRSINWSLCYMQDGRNIHKMISAGDVAELTALQRARCDWKRSQSRLWISDASFFKLRDVTLSLPVTSVLPWGESATLSLSARNAWRWYNKDWWAFDPEMAGNYGAATDNSGAARVSRGFSEHVPAAAVYSVSLRVLF